MDANGAGAVMLSRVDCYWRVAGTAFNFFVFGLGGLLLRVLVFPLINLLIWERQLRTMLARGVIRHAFRAFIGLLRLVGILRYEVEGLERLDRKGLLILANHPTLIDTVFLMSFVKSADCIVKSALWRNPFTHGPVRAAGYISNDSGTGLVEDCIKSLEGGSNLIIFPEGTRTPCSGEISLKRGAANIAIRGARNITPVVIHCYPLMLGKGVKWWRVPKSRSHFRIEVREDIDVRSFIKDAGSETLAARRLTDYLQDYFIKENPRDAAA
jgi:1-acyl-sn-glycerol-3-phosphate acyltransferase